MKVEITGKVYALDPIFSPVAYAKKVFGPNIDMVKFTTNGKCLEFSVKERVVGDLEKFVEDLIPSVKTGRKVQLTFSVAS